MPEYLERKALALLKKQNKQKQIMYQNDILVFDKGWVSETVILTVNGCLNKSKKNKDDKVRAKLVI